MIDYVSKFKVKNYDFDDIQQDSVPLNADDRIKIKSSDFPDNTIVINTIYDLTNTNKNYIK